MSAALKRKPSNCSRNGPVDPSRPLAKPSRELFAQDVAAGVPVKDAYVRAGYKGSDVSRYELRRCADIDARVNWLLAKRIEDDTRARHKAEKQIPDARDSDATERRVPSRGSTAEGAGNPCSETTVSILRSQSGSR